MNDLLVYWRQGEAIQNFGDFLSQYLFDELFLPIPLHPGRTYLVGSVIADFLVDAQTTTAPSVIFWGCGAREEAGLSAEAAAKARILAVRGPLTASALKLGATVPRGDPALLLPALYTPKPAVSNGRSVCIPHFWDDRTDAEQLAMSGCEQVLRPNLPNSRRRLLEMVDAIAASEFVLSASLHGAIVAAAYGRPFAFWDNCHLDVPFKWRDTAALLGIPAVFASNLAMGRAIHRDQIAPTLRIPPLSPLLFNAPFPLRPEAVLRVLAHETPIQGDAYAVLLDWSAGLAAGGIDASTTVYNLGEQLTLARQELARADHRPQELGAELAAAQLDAKDKISAMSAALADAREAQDAAALALLAAQAEASDARNATALVLAERDEAERRVVVAWKQWENFSSAVTSSFELPLGLDPQALSHQVESILDAHRHDAANARAQANDLKAELRAADEEAALTRLALTEMTQARDGSLERLTVAWKQWETFSSAVTSSFGLPLGLDPQALSHQVESMLDAHRHDAANARAQANDLKAELKAADEEAALTRLALTEMTQARDGALERLTKTARTEVRLREALRSAAVRSQYERRFVGDAKAASEAQSTEIDALQEQVTRAAFQRDRTEAEIRELQAELVVAHSDLSASVLMGQEAVSEVKTLRIELDQTSKRLHHQLVSCGRLEEELHSKSSEESVLEAELAALNATTTIKAMRWAASTLPFYKKLTLAAKVFLRAFVRRTSRHSS